MNIERPSVITGKLLDFTTRFMVSPAPYAGISDVKGDAMNKIQEQVDEFHITYNVHRPGFPEGRLKPGPPAFPPQARIDLRLKLIEEEFIELREAIAACDIVEVADALGDLLYVTFGTAIEFGIDMEPVNDEIHISNMSKLGADGKPLYADNGKVLKGPNFFPPNIRRVLQAQGMK